MSTRRLADEAVQPAEFAFNRDNATWAEKRIALYPEGRQQSAVIPLLMRAQDQEGWVSRAAIEQVAEMLGMAYIRVLEVATFYTQFQLQPVGSRAHVQVCGTTPCMLRGAEDLKAVCQRKIHAESHHLSDDGALSWEEVECAGACVNAPMVTIGHDTYEDLTPDRLEEIIDAFHAGEGENIPPGPQNERRFSAPVSGKTTLLEVPARHEHVEASGGSGGQPPTQPGRKREVPPEGAPALNKPARARKVSMAKAESERIATDEAAQATGEPNRAERPNATGAESPGGKAHGGAHVRGAETGALFVPPEGAADDLKLIAGIGPQLEKKLNDLGITQYAQIAAFTEADIATVDDALRFRGRVKRDNWVEQAAVLARGGAEEYRKVFGRDPR